MARKVMAALALTAALGMGAASAQNLIWQTKELGLSGLVDPDTADGTRVELDLRWGYFIYDGVVIGATASFADSDSLSSAGGGVYTEFNFETGGPAMPFVGLGLGVNYTKFDIPGLRGNRTVGVATPEAGVKVFLNENAAVSLSVLTQFATGEIYLRDNAKTSQFDWSIRLGLRFFYF